MSEPQNGHSGLVPEGCVDPSIRKYLKKFNAIPLHRLDDKRLMKPESFHEIIEHIFVCKFCRKQLSESGRKIFSSEMFWGGYFLRGRPKTGAETFGLYIASIFPLIQKKSWI